MKVLLWQPNTLTLQGTNFVPTSQVHIGGVALSQTFISPTQLVVDVPASIVPVAGAYTVDVTNPQVSGQGGGVTAATVMAVHPAPMLNSITPTTAEAATGNLQVTLDGDGFVPTSTVMFNGVAVPKQFYSASSLIATIPQALCASSGTYPITVINTPLIISGVSVGGGTSTAQTLVLTNPVPVVSSLAPDHALVNAATALTIDGTGFVPSATIEIRDSAGVGVLWATTATVVNPTQITTTLSAFTALNLPVGVYALTVTNPPSDMTTLDGGTSALARFEVWNPLPTLTSVSPTTATVSVLASATDLVLTLTGTNFVSTATVFFNTTALLPEPLSVTPTQITVTVPVQYLTPAGELPITVFNPAISTGVGSVGGGYSNALTFTLLNPVPIVTDLTPQPIVATAQATALTLVGDGFVQGMTARIDGVDIGAISVTDAQHASVTIPASALTLAGAHTLVLQNPAPAVGTGQVTTTFAVVTAQVASVVVAGVPSSIVAGAALPAFTVTDQYGNLVDTPNISFFNSSSKPDKS